MNLTHIASANDRITSLQTRLHDINTLLIEVLGISKGFDSSARANLKIAIRAITAVQSDLQSVCVDDLSEPANPSIAELAASETEIRHL